MFEGWPFHLTHRGNHKKTVFHSDRDRLAYLKLLQKYAERFAMDVWAYCLMPNHIHLIAVGREKYSISRAFGLTQQVHSSRENRAAGVTGHLWANRYFSSALDESHLWAAVRYIELNPVRAGLVSDATDYPWSSAQVHAGLVTSELLDPNRPFPGPIADWATWLRIGLDEDTIGKLRRNTAAGLPTGNDEFVAKIEARLQRSARARRTRKQPGRQDGVGCPQNPS